MKMIVLAILGVLVSGMARGEVQCLSESFRPELKIEDTFLGRMAQLEGEDFEVFATTQDNILTYISQEKILRLSIDLNSIEKTYPPIYSGSLYYRGLKKKVRCLFD